MPGKFELYKDKGGKFRWRLKAANGETILASQGYASRTGAKNGIASVQKNAADASRFECKEVRGGQCMFNLRATNGQIVGTSERYKTTRAQQNGIKSVQKNARGAQVVDLTAG